MTQSVKDRFGQFTRLALNKFISDRVYDRSKSAMTTGGEAPSDQITVGSDDAASSDNAVAHEDPEIVTTQEEIQGYYIVKATLHDVVDMKRVVLRNLRGLGNCRILLDDNQLKPICRLWFSGSQRYLGLLDEKKQEERVPIDDLDSIYKYADRLKATVSMYEPSE